MNVHVFGCTCIFGNQLVRSLIEHNHVVTCSSRSGSCGESCHQQIDITKRESVLEVVRHKPQVVVIAASFVPVPEGLEDWNTLIDINVDGIRNILDSVVDNVKKVVLISSGSVYGSNVNPTKMSEEYAVHPETPYSLTKLYQEQLVRAYCELYGVQCLILRLGYVTGINMDSRRLLRVICDSIANSQSIELAIAEDYILNLIDSSEVVDAICKLLPSKTGVFNIARREYETVSRVITACEQVTGNKHRVTYGTEIGDKGILVAERFYNIYPKAVNISVELLVRNVMQPMYTQS